MTKFENEYLSRVAYPLGGIGAGMICLGGTGALKNGKPFLEVTSGTIPYQKIEYEAA